MVHAVRRRKLRVLAEQRALARCAYLLFLYGNRNHTRHVRENGWVWFSVRSRHARLSWQLPRRRKELPFTSAYQYPGKNILVAHSLRHANAIGFADRPT